MYATTNGTKTDTQDITVNVNSDDELLRIVRELAASTVEG